MAESVQSMLSNLTVKAYIETTASERPVPGGGCAAALCAALAASLGEMVVTLTVGREKYRANDAEMVRCGEALLNYRKKMELYIDRDKDAYEKVLAAYGISREPSSMTFRKNEIEKALKMAAIVPAEVAKDAVQIMYLLEAVVQKGNKNAMTDGITGVLLARSAALSALLNVKVNLSSIHDDAFKETLEKEVEELAEKARQKERDILAWRLSI